MKFRLMVIRHAKSSWKDDDLSDHERPLNKRGKNDAPKVAAYLKHLKWIPDLCISSDSKRTKQTWKRMQPFLGKLDAEYTQALYHAEPDDVLPIIADVENDVKTLAIVGHNPGWEELVEWLTGKNIRMTTCNVALLTCKADSWEETVEKRGQWSVDKVVRPKDLPKGFS